MNEALAAPGVSLASDALIALRRIALNAAPASVLAALPGGFATRRKGHGLEVADMREYVPGDDIRHLDRGTTARTGRLHVRQFQEERDRVSLLIADFRPAMFWGLRRAFRSVAAAEALALIGWTVVETGGRVGLLAITQGAPVVVPPRGRTRGMLDVIGGLVQAHEAAMRAMMVGHDTDPPLDQALSRADRLTPSGSELLIASGFDAPGAELGDRLDALGRRRAPRLLMVTDGTTRALPRGRYPIRTSDGRRLRLQVDAPAEAAETAFVEEIEGRSALVVDAGEPVERIAQRLAAAFPARRRAA